MVATSFSTPASVLMTWKRSIGDPPVDGVVHFSTTPELPGVAVTVNGPGAVAVWLWVGVADTSELSAPSPTALTAEIL